MSSIESSTENTENKVSQDSETSSLLSSEIEIVNNLHWYEESNRSNNCKDSVRTKEEKNKVKGTIE